MQKTITSFSTTIGYFFRNKRFFSAENKVKEYKKTVYAIVAVLITAFLFRNPSKVFKGTSSWHTGTVILDCQDNGWYGRSGNNMLSIYHGILYAYSIGAKFVIAGCQHEFLQLTYLQNSLQAVRERKGERKGNVTLSNRFITPADGFYMYFNVSATEDVPLRLQHRLPGGAGCHRISILFPLIQYLATDNQLNDALIVSIRSGDVFLTGQPPPSIYTPPPLSFYVDIITNMHPCSELIIVSEIENLSPIAAKLMELYPERARLQSGTLEEDAMLILEARNLVLASSTFAWSLGMASKKLERIYSFDNQLQTLDMHGFSGVHVEEYYVDEYVKVWKNTPEQVEYLLDFPASKLKKRILDIPKC